jgi:hypothetical protein
MNRVKKVKSFERFSDDLWAQRPELIVVQAKRQPAFSPFGISRSIAVNGIGNYKYGLAYSVFDKQRQERYLEPLFTVFQSEHGLADTIDKNNRMIKVLLAGEVRVEQLSAILPESEIYLGGPDLKPIPQTVLEDLYLQSEELEIDPAEFVV